MVAYAYAAMYPDKVERLVVMDAPIPGIEPWNTILLNPGVLAFQLPWSGRRAACRRSRAYLLRPNLERFHGRSSLNLMKQPEISSQRAYAQPGGMRAGFAQFAAFSTDAADNKVFEQVKLTMPVLGCWRGESRLVRCRQ